MKRQQFIELAGGVLHNDQDYGDLNGADKSKIFWNFYTGDLGLVPSIYTGIPVGVIRSQSILRYSIEHIVPQSYLRANLDGEKENGSTVNPFNFAPAERRTNSLRSNFPFDFEEDSVVDSPNVAGLPATLTTGLDFEREWVVPTPSRGEIARAILYMSLVYSLADYAAHHVHVLKVWSLGDPPTAVERAYNDYVEDATRSEFNRAIRNPFIDTPSLVNDSELLGELRPEGATIPVVDVHPTQPVSIPPAPPPIRSPLRIVAALVNPVGGAPEPETVTLSNTGNETVPLTEFELFDKESRKLALSGTLGAGDTSRVQLQGSALQLSNSGGKITLKTRQGALVHEVFYARNEVRTQGQTILFG